MKAGAAESDLVATAAHPDWGQLIRERHPQGWPGGGGQVLNSVDVFSSVGGLTLGAGIAAASRGLSLRSRAAVDLDGPALEVHQANLGTEHLVRGSASLVVDSVVHGRGEGATFAYEPVLIDEVLASLAGEVDLLLAGPPCQGHSNLNNHTRRDDPRNDLYLLAPAIAVGLRAPMVVIENVPEVTSAKSDVVRTAISLLRGAGYHVVAGVIKATDLGWPQTRRRYFIVASRLTEPVPLADVVGALRAPARGVSWLLEDLLDHPAEGFMDAVPQLTEENRRRIDFLFRENLFNLPNDERPECHRSGTSYGATYGRMRWDEPAPTLTTGFSTPGRGRFIHPLRPRVLTPREAARIQGFPDWFSFGDAAAPPSRKQLTQWIGNAVPSPLGWAAVLSCLLPTTQ
jgi:DNA (cytosine-5)-methyltransferase 1